MASSRRFSISLLMAIVLCVALDFGVVRAFWDNPGPQVEVGIAALPMANMLLLTMPNLPASKASRPYWIGFELVGWIMAIATALLCWHDTRAFFWVITPMARYTRTFNVVAAKSLIISFGAVIFLMPQLFLAMLGGSLLARYQRVAIGLTIANPRVDQR